MKKRLLALALCLVMAVSLLPITAAAEGEFSVNSVYVVGTFSAWAFLDSNRMEVVAPDVYELTYYNYDYTYALLKFALNKDWNDTFCGTFGGSGVETSAVYKDGSVIQLDVPSIPADITFRLDLSKFDYATKTGATFTITITDANHQFENGWTSDATHHWHKCLNDGCTETSGKAAHTDNDRDHECDDCGASVHIWQFKAAGNTLTGTCRKGDIDPVTLTLKADSVTLPTSPFNARLEGLEQFKKEVPNAVIGEFVYKYKGPGDSEYSIVAPTAANAKAGEYQVGVRISGLPMGKEEYPPAAAYSLADGVNPDGAGYADLYVQYTAADPAITAQTGDNRPIELMMASVLVFSALAAAAFILDSKRRSQQ